MLTAKWPLSRMAGQVDDECAMHTSTSGGSSDTDVKELAARPDGPSGPWPVTTVTPVAKCPRTVRKWALSTPSSTVSGGSGSAPEGSISAAHYRAARTCPTASRGSAGRGAVVAVGPGDGPRPRG